MANDSQIQATRPRTENCDLIYPNDPVVLPNGRTALVKSGDVLGTLLVENGYSGVPPILTNVCRANGKLRSTPAQQTYFDGGECTRELRLETFRTPGAEKWFLPSAPEKILASPLLQKALQWASDAFKQPCESQQRKLSWQGRGCPPLQEELERVGLSPADLRTLEDKSPENLRLLYAFKLLVIADHYQVFSTPEEKADLKMTLHDLNPRLVPSIVAGLARVYENFSPVILEITGPAWKAPIPTDSSSPAIPSDKRSSQRQLEDQIQAKRIGNTFFFERGPFTILLAQGGPPKIYVDRSSTTEPVVDGTFQQETVGDLEIYRKFDAAGDEEVLIKQKGVLVRAFKAMPPKDQLTVSRAKFISYDYLKSSTSSLTNVLTLEDPTLKLQVHFGNMKYHDSYARAYTPLVPLDEIPVSHLGVTLIQITGVDGDFIAGGRNKTATIKELKTINGNDIRSLEFVMRPGQSSDEGFLGHEESLLAVMAEDNDFVLSRDLTHQQLALALYYMIAAFQYGMEEVTYRGHRYKVEGTAWRGFQHSPFSDGTKTNVDLLITRMDTEKSAKKSIEFSGLLADMIHRYGFYEGKGTPYRLEPKDVIEIFDLTRPY